VVIELFGRNTPIMKEIIARTDSTALKTGLVNSFKFHEIDDALTATPVVMMIA